MKTACKVCVCCDERAGIFRHEDPDEAERRAEQNARECGWRRLGENKRRGHALWVCPWCIAEIHGPFRLQLMNMQARLDSTCLVLDGVLRDTAAPAERDG